MITPDKRRSRRFETGRRCSSNPLAAEAAFFWGVLVGTAEAVPLQYSGALSKMELQILRLRLRMTFFLGMAIV
jgi:hypothetical protein